MNIQMGAGLGTWGPAVLGLWGQRGRWVGWKEAVRMESHKLEARQVWACGDCVGGGEVSLSRTGGRMPAAPRDVLAEVAGQLWVEPAWQGAQNMSWESAQSKDRSTRRSWKCQWRA